MRNIISANGGDGILYSDSAATVQGNYIGTDITGTLDRGNTALGIEILGDRRDASDSTATTMTIGGTGGDEGNLISGNDLGGIWTRNANAVIQGNRIGTQADGTSPLGNSGEGVRAFEVLTNPVLSVIVGGAAAGAGNVIAYNGIGVSADAGAVTILRNSLFGNVGQGLSISGFLAVPAPPVLTGVTGTTIAGTLSGPAGATLHVEFFATPNEPDEGKTFLGFSDVPIDGSGSATFGFDPPGGVPAGQFLTATATNANGTSNFSAPVGTGAPESPAADVGVAVADAPDPVAAGTNLAYTIVVSNNGPSSAQGLTLTIAVPASATFVSFTAPTGWTATTPTAGGIGSISATAASLGTGAAGSASFTLVVQVDAAANAGSQISLAAHAAATTNDPTSANNSHTELTTVAAAPGANAAPQANPDEYGVTSNVTLAVPARGVLSNDFDAEGTVLSANLTTQPLHGLVVLNADGSFSYTPATGYSGPDTFTYRVNDGVLSSVAATVALNVVPAPTTGDTIGPHVMGLQRFGFHAQPTVLVLSFDEGLAPAGASNPANYRLVAPGRDGRFGTRDDVVFALRSATYDPISATVKLLPKRLLLLRQRYQLAVHGGPEGLTDAAGNGVGTPGVDTIVRFDQRALAGPSTGRGIPKGPARIRFARIARARG